jgi:hypothetical protein
MSVGSTSSRSSSLSLESDDKNYSFFKSPTLSNRKFVRKENICFPLSMPSSNQSFKTDRVTPSRENNLVRIGAGIRVSLCYEKLCSSMGVRLYHLT